MKQIKKYSDKTSIVFVDYSTDFYTQLFEALCKRNILSLIIEGGEQVLTFFIKNNLWDEALIFKGDKEFSEGIKAPKINSLIAINEQLGNSKLSFIKK